MCLRRNNRIYAEGGRVAMEQKRKWVSVSAWRLSGIYLCGNLELSKNHSRIGLAETSSNNISSRSRRTGSYTEGCWAGAAGLFRRELLLDSAGHCPASAATIDAQRSEVEARTLRSGPALAAATGASQCRLVDQHRALAIAGRAGTIRAAAFTITQATHL
jgi:hypothetical protein